MKNVIYIIADQMRWDALACNGADFMDTAHLDRLAAEGVNFSCTYSGNPVCVPARGILATGCCSHRCMDPSGCNRNSGNILPQFAHIADLLRRQGYGTYGLGKCHRVPYKCNPGFDVFEVAEEGRIELAKSQGQLPADVEEDYLVYLEKVGYGGMQRAHGIGNNDPRAGEAPMPLEHYVDTWATTRSRQCLEQHLKDTPDKPFYLQLGFVKPHAPYDPPAPYNTMYDPRQVPRPWGSVTDLADRNPAMADFHTSYLIDRMSPAAIQYSRAHYFGLVTYLDHQIGRVLSFLDEHDLADDTVIVFTADHGDNIGDHGIFFKTFFTEGATRIPLIIRAAGQTVSGGRYDKPIGQEDIMPTICDLLDATIPNPIDGVSLKDCLSDPQSTTVRPFAISQYNSGDGMTMMLRDEHYKYCYARMNGAEELYNLERDPHELTNLAGDPQHADQLTEIREKADTWCRQHDHEPIIDESGHVIRTEYRPVEAELQPTNIMGWRPW